MNKVIATCFDQKFKLQAENLVVSCKEKGQWTGDFLFILPFYDEEYFKTLEEKGIYYFCVNPDNFTNILCQERLHEKWNYTVMLRFFLFLLESVKKWDEILYLDSDIICLNKIILKDVDWLEALCEYYKGTLKKVPCWTDFVLKMKTEEKWFFSDVMNSIKFNSGILHYPTRILTFEFKERLLNYLNSYIHFYMNPDQGILNLLFYNDWNLMDDHYGSMKYFLEQNWNEVNKMTFFHCYGVYSKFWEKEGFFHEEWKKNEGKFKYIRIENTSEEIQVFKNNVEKELEDYSDSKVYSKFDIKKNEIKSYVKMDVEKLSLVVKKSLTIGSC